MNKALLDFLIGLLANTQAGLETTMEKFVKDIHFRYQWDAENIYKMSARITLLKSLIKNLQETKEPVPVATLVASLTKKILSPTLMDRSTNQITVLTSIWDKEIVVVLIESLEWNKYIIEPEVKNETRESV